MLTKMRHRLKSYGELIWANTDFITKWVQVLALVLAAYWTITRYMLVEAPSHEQTVEVIGGFDDKDSIFSIPGGCYVSYKLSVANRGNVSFDVDRIQIRAWRTDLPTLGASKGPKFQDLDVIERSDPIINTNFDSNTHNAQALVRHFSPAQGSTQYLRWAIPNANPPLIIFRADAYSKEHWFGKSESWLGYTETPRQMFCQ